MQRLGKRQKAIIAALGVKPMTVVELAAQIYGVEASALTRSQEVTVRQALMRLAEDNLVKQSFVFAREGSNCWVLDRAQIREEPKPRLRAI